MSSINLSSSSPSTLSLSGSRFVFSFLLSTSALFWISYWIHDRIVCDLIRIGSQWFDVSTECSFAYCFSQLHWVYIDWCASHSDNLLVFPNQSFCYFSVKPSNHGEFPNSLLRVEVMVVLMSEIAWRLYFHSFSKKLLKGEGEWNRIERERDN